MFGGEWVGGTRASRGRVGDRAACTAAGVLLLVCLQAFAVTRYVRTGAGRFPSVGGNSDARRSVICP